MVVGFAAQEVHRWVQAAGIPFPAIRYHTGESPARSCNTPAATQRYPCSCQWGSCCFNRLRFTSGVPCAFTGVFAAVRGLFVAVAGMGAAVMRLPAAVTRTHAACMRKMPANTRAHAVFTGVVATYTRMHAATTRTPNETIRVNGTFMRNRTENTGMVPFFTPQMSAVQAPEVLKARMRAPSGTLVSRHFGRVFNK